MCFKGTVCMCLPFKKIRQCFHSFSRLKYEVPLSDSSINKTTLLTFSVKLRT